MKRQHLIAFILPVFVLLLSACGGTSTPAPIPTASAIPEQDLNSVTASANVIPATYVELSFPMTGRVKTVEVAAGELVTKDQVLIRLDATILEAHAAEAEANLAAAETQVRYLQRVGTANEHLESAVADVDRAQAALDSAKAQLAQATLTAPIGGTIVSVDISPAETVIPGQIVVVIGDLTQMQIETTDLSERDVPRVTIGAKATVFIDALNQEFAGKVVEISRQAEAVGGDVVYKVTVSLDEQPESLRWGMSAEVRIQTEQ
jgi:RND family efflux transporter MFP subunit